MTDKLGVFLHIGDKVGYTTGSQCNESIEIGTIINIRLSKSLTAVEIAEIRSEGGRKLTNPRYSWGLISIVPIAAQHPELFI